MKKIFFLSAILAGAVQVFAQSDTRTFKVYGNCNMCKKRIEKAATVDGVSKADWNKDTKAMAVTFDAAKTSTDAIQKKIAASGHDTDKEKAADSTYNTLPGCCHYDRKGGAAAAPAHAHH
ncbi:MAG TPA: heavy-metal-associated domain-containing protein [Chitinophaga sp.]|uniref:heavy-metal-associated domain-containing protein n=1 Tax=Chitinophaga sp. TaxID=1869181 RepID=UPI002C3EEAC3|nr:heavy-metal-associated domain-containing protein [Chitinophaga sp.]HVI48761.1 heavy-metal-associated domain-containing protein [Chitinophaga sp.]